MLAVARSDSSHLSFVCMDSQVHVWRMRGGLDRPTITTASYHCRLSSGDFTSAFYTLQLQTSFICCCPCQRQEFQNMSPLLAFISASSFPVYGSCLISGFYFTLIWTISRVLWLAFLTLVGWYPLHPPHCHCKDHL